MKKTFFSILSLGVVISSCKSDRSDEVTIDCKALAVESTTAVDVYLKNATEENCLTYRAALQALIKNNCQSEEGSAFLQLELDSFSCN